MELGKQLCLQFKKIKMSLMTVGIGNEFQSPDWNLEVR